MGDLALLHIISLIPNFPDVDQRPVVVGQGLEDVEQSAVAIKGGGGQVMLLLRRGDVIQIIVNVQRGVGLWLPGVHRSLSHGSQVGRIVEQHLSHEPCAPPAPFAIGRPGRRVGAVGAAVPTLASALGTDEDDGGFAPGGAVLLPL